jgi:hypothetical protein
MTLMSNVNAIRYSELEISQPVQPKLFDPQHFFVSVEL